MVAFGETAHEFLVWWGGQLRELLPERLAGSSGHAGDGLWIQHRAPAPDRPGQIALSVRKGADARPLGTFALEPRGLEAARRAAAQAGRPAPVVLQLGPGYALEKSLTMPLAVERDLDRVVGFEMDRETPFAAEEVYWQAQVLRRDREQGRIEIALTVVPKALVSDIVEPLREAALAPALLFAQLPDGSAARPIRVGAVREGASERNRPALVLGLVAVMLALAACGLPFIRQGQALDRLNARIAALRPAVGEAEALRQKIAASGAELLSGERQRVADPLQVLATTTKALPDDTYLTDLALKARKLSLIGQSASAARLLSALAANPAYANPVFAAPVTKLEGSAREAFSIDADVRE